ncbi:MAG: hypothetical protein SVU32_00450 [Candidatus Nanohaloarchaea archaeon]|nr:hypothetical protein [Candidatus Nanohaloarchaea archaeon]
MTSNLDAGSYAALLASLNDNLEEEQVQRALERSGIDGEEVTFNELLDAHSRISITGQYREDKPVKEVGDNSAYKGERLDGTSIDRDELERRSQVQGKAIHELEHGLDRFLIDDADIEDEPVDVLLYQFDLPELDNLEELDIQVEEHAVDIYRDDQHVFHDMTPQHCLDLEKEGNYLLENTGEYEADLNNGLLSIEVPVTYTDPHEQQTY